MLFGQQPPSPYDLKFRLFGIPHRVSPMFFLGSGIVTYSFAQADFAAWIIAILCISVNFLIHELGHGLAYQRFRADPVIEFGFLNGVTIPDHRLYERWKRVVTILAGPLSGLAFAAVIYYSEEAFHWVHRGDYSVIVYIMLFYGALFLNCFNLLPIYPLDGGQLMMEGLTAHSRNGMARCFEISLFLALAYVGYSLAVMAHLMEPVGYGAFRLPVGYFTVIIFGLIAVMNYQSLQRLRR